MIHFDFLGVRIGLQVSGRDEQVRDLCDLLDVAFRPHLVQEGGPAGDFRRALVAADGDTERQTDVIYSISLGETTRCFQGQQLLFETGRSAFPLVESLLCESALCRLDRFVQLHAGAVSRKGACCLLPGPSGSGKSTLVLALASRMLDCVGDDVTLVDPASARIIRFSCALRVKSTGYEVAERQASCRPLYTDEAVRYYALTPSAEERLLPRLIVFPVYRPGEETTSRPMPGAEAAARLVSNCINMLECECNALDVAVSLVNGARCVALRVGDIDVAAEQIARLMDGVE